MNREARKLWDEIAAMGCIVTGGPATIHHAHGASMKERGFHRAIGRKVSDWLVIPLAFELHIGDEGIDRIGVLRWEMKYGKQADMIDLLCQRLGVDLWQKARDEQRGMVPRRAA